MKTAWVTLDTICGCIITFRFADGSRGTTRYDEVLQWDGPRMLVCVWGE